jgi:hypothetical protein
MESKPLELPKEWKDKIERDAQYQASLHFHSKYSPDQHTACMITYRQGAMGYAAWLYTCQTNYAALQAKCDMYEAVLKELVRLKELKDKHGKTEEYLKAQPLAWEAANEALSGEGEKEVELSCMVCGEKFMGPEPKGCCSGRDCGCMGMPIDPIVCSKECYDHLTGNNKKDFDPCALVKYVRENYKPRGSLEG